MVAIQLNTIVVVDHLNAILIHINQGGYYENNINKNEIVHLGLKKIF